MVEFLRWLLRIKSPREIDADVKRDKTVQRGEASIILGERVAEELEAIERRRKAADGRR